MSTLSVVLAATAGEYSKFINPDGYKIEGNFGERMMFGLEVAALGLIIVFTVLIILWLFLETLGYFMYKRPKKKEEKRLLQIEVENSPERAIEFMASPAVPVAASPVQAAAPQDDMEEIAAVSAAIAAYLGKPQSGFVVRSIKRLSNWTNK